MRHEPFDWQGDVRWLSPASWAMQWDQLIRSRRDRSLCEILLFFGRSVCIVLDTFCQSETWTCWCTRLFWDKLLAVSKCCLFVFFFFLHYFLTFDCFFFFRDVFSQGLSCQILNVRSLHFRKLNIVGEFAQLHTLVLDSNRVTGFGEGCFSCMPNLTCLSMCDTVVSDLWTASSALLKLPSLEDLRFQDWICCSESSSSTPLKPQSSDENMFDESKNSSTEADFSGVFQQMDPEEDDLDSLYAEVFMGEKVKRTHI